MNSCECETTCFRSGPTSELTRRRESIPMYRDRQNSSFIIHPSSFNLALAPAAPVDRLVMRHPGHELLIAVVDDQSTAGGPDDARPDRGGRDYGAVIKRVRADFVDVTVDINGRLPGKRREE